MTCYGRIEGTNLWLIMKIWTERLALQLLKDNGHLKSFLVDLDGIGESRGVARKLRAEGCTVTIHRIKNRLRVTPPRQLAV